MGDGVSLGTNICQLQGIKHSSSLISAANYVDKTYAVGLTRIFCI